MVAEAITCGPDLGRHLEAIERYENAGFDELHVQRSLSVTPVRNTFTPFKQTSLY